MAWLRSMIVPLSIVGSLGLSSAVLAEDLKLAEAEDSELISQAEAEIEINRTDENGNIIFPTEEEIANCEHFARSEALRLRYSNIDVFNIAYGCTSSFIAEIIVS